MPPPSPLNRARFLGHVDENPAWRKTEDEIRAEGLHLTFWLLDEDVVGKPPTSGLVLAWLGRAVGVAGGCLSILGLAGYIVGPLGHVATLGGAFATVLGYGITQVGNTIVADRLEAIELVEIRLGELQVQIDAIAEGRRLPVPPARR